VLLNKEADRTLLHQPVSPTSTRRKDQTDHNLFSTIKMSSLACYSDQTSDHGGPNLTQLSILLLQHFLPWVLTPRWKWCSPL